MTAYIWQSANLTRNGKDSMLPDANEINFTDIDKNHKHPAKSNKAISFLAIQKATTLTDMIM